MQYGISKQQQRGLRALNVLLFVVTGWALLGYYATPHAPVNLKALTAKPLDAEGNAQPIPLNFAQATDLLQLKGFGPKTVEKIIYCRKCLGGFTDKRQLLRVAGVGEKTLARLDSQLTVTVLGLHIWQTTPALRPWTPQQTANLNAISTDALYRVCVLEKDAARRILNKRKSLGGFKDWRDIAALKGVNWQTIAALQRHFHIAPPQQISLNNSTITQLMQLPRVGKTTAERIMAYRSQLGGFHALDQLDDVKGIGPKTMAGFRGRIQATAPQTYLQKIDLRNASEATLASHPYISDLQATDIIRNRKNTALSREVLLEAAGFTPADVQRLLPYLQ